MNNCNCVQNCPQLQYTHSAIWAIIAEAMLGFGEKAIELYKMINPIEHSRTREATNKYKVEPYVISADVYGAENLAGRGGWTWYTGSSSWFYIAGIEYILGIKIKNNTLSFAPCIPKEWKEFNCKYKYGDSIYNIKVINPNGKNTGVKKILLDGKELLNNDDLELTKEKNQSKEDKKDIMLDGSGKVFNVEVEM